MKNLIRLFSIIATMIALSAFQSVSAQAGASSQTAAAAEVNCNSFTNVNVGVGWYLHVPSVGPNSGNFNCVVVRGHQGITVLVLQETLNACYKQGIRPDQIFGGNTEQAVKNAQTKINQDHGRNVLTADGRFGPVTSSYFSFQVYDYNNGANGRPTGICYNP